MASDAVREALEHLDEWAALDRDHITKSCLWCRNYEHQGHRADCKRQAALAALDAAQPQQDAYQNAVMMLRKLAYNPIRFTKEEIRDALCRWGLQGNILRDIAARARQERA